MNAEEREHFVKNVSERISSMSLEEQEEVKEAMRIMGIAIDLSEILGIKYENFMCAVKILLSGDKYIKLIK